MAYSPDEREKAISTVLDGLRLGTPLTVICSGDGMPCDDTVRIWAEQDQELSRAIARARETGFDAIAMEALSIADDTSSDTRKGKDGDEQPNTEWITRSRLRVETRLKLLAKWDPKRYGDLVKVGNADGSNIAEPMDETAKITRLSAIVAAVRRAENESSNDAG